MKQFFKLLTCLLLLAFAGCDKIEGFLGPSKADIEREVKGKLSEMVADTPIGKLVKVVDVCDVALVKSSKNKYNGMGSVKLRSKSGSWENVVKYSLDVSVDTSGFSEWQYYIEAKPMNPEAFVPLFAQEGTNGLFD